MSDKAETAAIRLWRDRAHLREQERDEAQARARSETEQQMEDLRTALLSLLDQSSGRSLH